MTSLAVPSSCVVTQTPIGTNSGARRRKRKFPLLFVNCDRGRIEIDHLYGLCCRGWYCNPEQHSLCRPARPQAAARRPAQLVLFRIAVPTTPAQTVSWSIPITLSDLLHAIDYWPLEISKRLLSMFQQTYFGMRVVHNILWASVAYNRSCHLFLMQNKGFVVFPRLFILIDTHNIWLMTLLWLKAYECNPITDFNSISVQYNQNEGQWALLCKLHRRDTQKYTRDYLSVIFVASIIMIKKW